MIKVPATFWNLLKKLGANPEKMKWDYLFGYLAATDLSDEQQEQMRRHVGAMTEKRITPISGYIYEFPKKGAYFVPVGPGMIMKIKCKLPKPSCGKKYAKHFTLQPGYRNEE